MPTSGGTSLSDKLVEERLLGEQAKYRAIIETAVDGIVVIDERGIVQAFNRAAEMIFGYAADEVIGHNVSHLMPEPDRSQHDGYIANFRRTGEAKIIGVRREVTGQRKDGSVFALDLSIAEWHAGGQRYFTGIIQDITARKEAETEYEANDGDAPSGAEDGGSGPDHWRRRT